MPFHGFKNSEKKRKGESIPVKEIMFDTDILVDLNRGLKDCEKFFDNLPEDLITCISPISKMELFAGCRNKAEEKDVEELLSDFVILPIRAKESLEACNLYIRFHLSHGVGILDSFIASCAIGSNIVLYTKNEKHFRIFPGIKVTRPY